MDPSLPVLESLDSGFRLPPTQHRLKGTLCYRLAREICYVCYRGKTGGSWKDLRVFRAFLWCRSY